MIIGYEYLFKEIGNKRGYVGKTELNELFLEKYSECVDDSGNKIYKDVSDLVEKLVYGCGFRPIQAILVPISDCIVYMAANSRMKIRFVTDLESAANMFARGATIYYFDASNTGEIFEATIE